MLSLLRRKPRGVALDVRKSDDESQSFRTASPLMFLDVIRHNKDAEAVAYMAPPLLLAAYLSWLDPQCSLPRRPETMRTLARRRGKIVADAAARIARRPDTGIVLSNALFRGRAVDCKFSRDGAYFMCVFERSSSPGRAKRYNLVAESVSRHFAKHCFTKQDQDRVHLSVHGRFVAVSVRGKLELWDTLEGFQTPISVDDSLGAVTFFMFSPNERYLCVTDRYSELRVYDLESPKRAQTPLHRLTNVEKAEFHEHYQLVRFIKARTMGFLPKPFEHKVLYSPGEGLEDMLENSLLRGSSPGLSDQHLDKTGNKLDRKLDTWLQAKTAPLDLVETTDHLESLESLTEFKSLKSGLRSPRSSRSPGFTVDQNGTCHVASDPDSSKNGQVLARFDETRSLALCIATGEVLTARTMSHVQAWSDDKCTKYMEPHFALTTDESVRCLKIQDYGRGCNLYVKPLPSEIISLNQIVISDNGRVLALKTEDNRMLALYDISRSAAVPIHLRHAGAVRPGPLAYVAFSPDGRFLVTLSKSRGEELYVWRLDKSPAHPIIHVRGLFDSKRRIANTLFSPDSRYFVAPATGCILLYEMDDLEVRRHKIPCLSDSVSVAFDPESRFFHIHQRCHSMLYHLNWRRPPAKVALCDVAPSNPQQPAAFAYQPAVERSATIWRFFRRPPPEPRSSVIESSVYKWTWVRFSSNPRYAAAVRRPPGATTLQGCTLYICDLTEARIRFSKLNIPPDGYYISPDGRFVASTHWVRHQVVITDVKCAPISSTWTPNDDHTTVHVTLS